MSKQIYEGDELARRRAANKKWHATHPVEAQASHYLANKRFNRRHPERAKEQRRISNRMIHNRLRSALIVEFGGACTRCGFDDVRALQFDHVHGGGRRDSGITGRYTIHKAAYETLRIRFQNGELQLLCANCNWIKRVEENECRAQVANV